MGWGLPALTHSHHILPSWQREVDRNQELLTRIRQLQEREAEVEEKMKEQQERSRLCKQSLDVASKKLREKEDGLAEAGEVRALQGGALLRPLFQGDGCVRSTPLWLPDAFVSSSPSHTGANIFCIFVVIVKILIFHSMVFS